MRRPEALLALCAFAVLMLPSWQGLIDLPGHVARYHVSLELGHSPALQRYFGFHWELLPNLGVDLLVYPLARLIGLDLAVRIVVAAIPAIAVLGITGLARAYHGRLPFTAICAAALALSYPLTNGFVNSCLSIALAFCAGAVWHRLVAQDGWWRPLLFGGVVAPLLMVAHLTGWGVFGLIAFASAIAQAWPRGRFHALRRSVLVCLPLTWPLLVLVALRRGDAGQTSGWLDLPLMLTWAGGVFRERVAAVDLASALLLFALVALPLVLRRRFAFHPAGLLAAALCWATVLLLPSMMLGSAFANVRLIAPALALSVVAVQPTVPMPRWTVWLALLFVALRFAVTANALLAFDRIAQRDLRVLDRVAPGSRVLGLTMLACERQWAPPRHLNLQLLATERRDALTNGHFTEAGGQLLTIHYPAAQAWMHYGENTVMSRPCRRWNRPVLAAALARAPLPAFDYVWLLHVPDALAPHDPRLALVAAEPASALYRVVTPAPPR